MELVYWNNLTATEKSRALARSISKDDQELQQLVSTIITDVQQKGDWALFEYALQFDQVNITELAVSTFEFEKAVARVHPKYKESIIKAKENIEYYHRKGAPNGFEYNAENGEICLGKFYRPIERVGLYIPGGTAPLVSTLLMLAIPAQIAGCPLKVLVTPPNRDGSVNDAILFAAKLCGITEVYKVGGAQAIAALSFGTQSIPKVDKVFGPGNKYVTEAKLQVSRMVGGAALDMPAGPSEVLVIADEHAKAEFIASDLLAQAEHDTDAQVILVTPDINLATKVLKELELQTTQLSRAKIIASALRKSRVIISSNLDECFKISNQYAPEHLILHIANAKEMLSLVINAGSVFVGEYSPESVGDYASGTNHVLPTYGYAKMYSGLDVAAFMKGISFQSLSAQGLLKLGPTVEDLATLEGLDGHRNAVSIRLKHIESKLNN